MPAQEIEPYPMGVSIIQDPKYMNHQNGPRRDSDRKALHNIKESKIALQQKFEESYAKPTAANQDQLDQLYFRGGSQHKVGSRIQP